MNKSVWLERLVACYKTTVSVFESIYERTGYKYKDLKGLKILEHKNTPTWSDCKIRIGFNNHPESIAYEFAHGLHEVVRDTMGKKDMHGGKFCNALRYYIETTIDTDSEWLNELDIEDNIFLRNYKKLEDFVDALKTDKMFDDVDWKNLEEQGN